MTNEKKTKQTNETTKLKNKNVAKDNNKIIIKIILKKR